MIWRIVVDQPANVRPEGRMTSLRSFTSGLRIKAWCWSLWRFDRTSFLQRAPIIEDAATETSSPRVDGPGKTGMRF